MRGRNEVVLEGFLRFPELKETKNNNFQFVGKVAVPFNYTDKQTGEQKEGQKYIKISAWGDTAQGLASLDDGTPLRVTGYFNDRAYDGSCKECGSLQKKNWTDVSVNNYLVIEA